MVILSSSFKDWNHFWISPLYSNTEVNFACFNASIGNNSTHSSLGQEYWSNWLPFRMALSCILLDEPPVENQFQLDGYKKEGSVSERIANVEYSEQDSE